MYCEEWGGEEWRIWAEGRRRTEDCCGMFAVLARTLPSHLSGLDLNSGVKGQREHLRGNSLGQYTQTSKHTIMYESVCESVSPSALSHTYFKLMCSTSVYIIINIHPCLVCFSNTVLCWPLAMKRSAATFPKSILWAFSKTNHWKRMWATGCLDSFLSRVVLNEC